MHHKIEMKINRILIPCDLKEDSYNALNHAAFIGREENAELILLHVVSNEKNRAEANIELQAWAEQLQQGYLGVVKTLIEVGDFVELISEIAEREQCNLVVMPTHGMRGLQRITGSLALKVVSESHLPFIVVQRRAVREHGYKKMVIPVSDRPALLDELEIFIQLAQHFTSEVHLVVRKENVAHEIQTFEAVRSSFEKAGISLHIHFESHVVSFAKHVANYAAGIDADLICAVNFSFEYLYTLFPRTEEEDFIYNEAQIPVLLITPQQSESAQYFIPMWH
jgi:nucleotide-binding universal stress UspA family protein